MTRAEFFLMSRDARADWIASASDAEVNALRDLTDHLIMFELAAARHLACERGANAMREAEQAAALAAWSERKR